MILSICSGSCRAIGDLLWQKRVFGSYCEEIDDAIWCLEMAGELSEVEKNHFTGSDDDDEYAVEDKLVNCWRKYSQPVLTDVAQAELEALALDFSRLTQEKLS